MTKGQVTERAHLVGSEFVRLYYKVMNSYSAYLNLFYEQDSTVTVCESQDGGKPISMQAATQESVQQLLCWMYDDVHVTLLTCIPQNSLHDCILLLTAGRMMKKSYKEERFFSQALLLTKQEKGYYVKTDIMHVMSRNSAIEFKLLPIPESTNEDVAEASTSEELELQATKHQPKDSCLECHMELSTMHPKPSKNPISDNHRIEATSNTFATSKAIPMVRAHSNIPFETKSVSIPSSCRVSPSGLESQNPMSTPADFSPLGGSSYNADFSMTSPMTSVGDLSSPKTIPVPELTSLFAARLPIGITPAVVRDLFSVHGKLRNTNPVRVFTGLTNCYACVNFQSETEMRKAMEATIFYQNEQIVTEIWKPRDRRGRRVGRDVLRSTAGPMDLARRGFSSLYP